MKKITIKQFRDCKRANIGCWEYMHLISFKEDGHAYTVFASDECMHYYMMPIFKEAGYEVTFIQK